MDECIEQDVSNWMAFEDIWTAYLDFCAEEGLPSAAKEGLGQALNADLGFPIEGSRRIPEDEDRQKRGYVGLELVE